MTDEALKAGQRHKQDDMKAIQAIHDGSLSLGAYCGDCKTLTNDEQIKSMDLSEQLFHVANRWNEICMSENSEGFIPSATTWENITIEAVTDDMLVGRDNHSKLRWSWPYALVDGEAVFEMPRRVKRDYIEIDSIVPSEDDTTSEVKSQAIDSTVIDVTFDADAGTYTFSHPVSVSVKSTAVKSMVVGADSDLPIVEQESWDGTAAKARIFAWADIGGENPRPEDAKKLFLIYEDEEGGLRRGDYRLPFGDIDENGEPFASTSGLTAARQRISQTDAPDKTLEQAQGILDDYKAKWEAMTTVEREGSKPIDSNALKTIRTTENELVVGNHIMLFGDTTQRDLEGLGSYNKNSDGSIGEYFTPETDWKSAYTDTGRLMIDWEHGKRESRLDPTKDDVLGYVDMSTAKVTDRGLWVERVLNRRNKYVQWIEHLIDAGLVSNSSEASPKGVKKANNGRVISWPLKRDTFTVEPMEPRMMKENTLAAIKSIAEINEPFKLKAIEAGLLESDQLGDAGASRLQMEAELLALQLELEILE